MCGLEGSVDPLETLVLDSENAVVGRLRGTHRDPRTRSVRALLVSLDREAQRRLELPGPDLLVPVRMVEGLRKDAILLDRSLDALRREVTQAYP